MAPSASSVDEEKVPDSTKLKILTVDDSDSMRYSVARCLKDGGYDVTEARTGTEALVLAAEDPALITLDINLPDMNGFEVCRRIKQNPETSHIPVLHISASFVDTEHKIRGLEGGADAYLMEPVDPDELLATVRTLIRIRKAEKEARQRAAEANEIKEELTRLNQNLESRVRDRTIELERRNAAVQELSRRLLRAQDQERRRVSRELHDSTGQLLVTLKLRLAEFKAEGLAGNKRAEELVTQMSSMVEEITRQLRTMSYLLHPPLLDEAGLESALRWYIQGFSQRSDIQVNLEFPGDLGRLSQDLEITIFRIVQESLTNIHRHSGSKTASIRLTREPECVQLEIADQGKGLPTEVGSKVLAPSTFFPGVGILGMKERVNQFGGSFQIGSQSVGTSTLVRLPIDQHEVSSIA